MTLRTPARASPSAMPVDTSPDSAGSPPDARVITKSDLKLIFAVACCCIVMIAVCVAVTLILIVTHVETKNKIRLNQCAEAHVYTHRFYQNGLHRAAESCLKIAEKNMLRSLSIFGSNEEAVVPAACRQFQQCMSPHRRPVTLVSILGAILGYFGLV